MQWREWKGGMRESAFFSWNFLGIPVFANNFMESKVRLNSVLEMYHCMEDCLCRGKQSRDRVALCLMWFLTSHRTFNSSQNAPVWAGLFWRFPSMPVPKLQSGYQAHTHRYTAQAPQACCCCSLNQGEHFCCFSPLPSPPEHSLLLLEGVSPLPPPPFPSCFPMRFMHHQREPWWEQDQKLDLGELWG